MGPKIKNETTEFGRFIRMYIPPKIPIPFRTTEAIVVISPAFALIPPLSNQPSKIQKTQAKYNIPIIFRKTKGIVIAPTKEAVIKRENNINKVIPTF